MAISSTGSLSNPDSRSNSFVCAGRKRWNSPGCGAIVSAENIAKSFGYFFFTIGLILLDRHVIIFFSDARRGPKPLQQPPVILLLFPKDHSRGFLFDAGHG